MSLRKWARNEVKKCVDFSFDSIDDMEIDPFKESEVIPHDFDSV